MGCTPLLYSLHKGHTTIATYLVSQGASIAGTTCKAWETRGFTAFHYAAAYRSAELLRLLLDRSPMEIYINRDPIHPLHLAVLNCSSECVELMLDYVSQGTKTSARRYLQRRYEKLINDKEKPC